MIVFCKHTFMYNLMLITVAVTIALVLVTW